MVQKRPRYMVGWMPRVNGYSPGKPRSRAASKPCKSAWDNTGSSVIFPVVSNDLERSGARSMAFAYGPWSHSRLVVIGIMWRLRQTGEHIPRSHVLWETK